MFWFGSFGSFSNNVKHNYGGVTWNFRKKGFGASPPPHPPPPENCIEIFYNNVSNNGFSFPYLAFKRGVWQGGHCISTFLVQLWPRSLRSGGLGLVPQSAPKSEEKTGLELDYTSLYYKFGNTANVKKKQSKYSTCQDRKWRSEIVHICW